jgi:transcriptional regulator with XRE-family HTH domain
MSRKKSLSGFFPGLKERIKEIRDTLTQTQFGKIIGVNQGTVWKYESGRIPDKETLEKIAAHGGVTVEWLLSGETSKTPAAKTQEFASVYDASPLPFLAEAALTEIIAAVEDYYARHRLKRRPIQKSRLIIRLYQHYAETREKPDDMLIKRNLILAD